MKLEAENIQYVLVRVAGIVELDRGLVCDMSWWMLESVIGGTLTA